MAQAANKAAVLEALIAQAESDLTAVTVSQQESQAGATHAEAKPESDKDTRATEASYLARGLAVRVSDLQEAVRVLKSLALRPFGEDTPIALSALVGLEDSDGFVSHYFVAPAGGGISVKVAGTAVAIITPGSPLGRAVLGKRLDDDLTLKTATRTRELTVVSVV